MLRNKRFRKDPQREAILMAEYSAGVIESSQSCNLVGWPGAMTKGGVFSESAREGTLEEAPGVSKRQQGQAAASAIAPYYRSSGSTGFNGYIRLLC